MPVTAEDVTNAYRWLLGREPDEQGLNAWLGAESREKLRSAFVASPEFRSWLTEPAPRKEVAPAHVPRILPFNDVEWRADPGVEAPLVEFIRLTWKRLGAERPHWSVLSADRFKPEQIKDHSAEFYQSGDMDVELVLNVLQNNGRNPNSVRSVVEYGCGVGRVTPYLAARFPRVTAIDISASHLTMARQHCADRPSVAFVTATQPEFGMTEPFDLWFSNLVLQHNPPPIIARILERMFTLLAPGGVAIFQVPTWCHGYRFRIEGYLASRPAEPTIEVHCLPQWVIFHLAHRAGCLPLEVREDHAMEPPHWASHLFVFCKPTGCVGQVD
jgi:SAM-dependent methyltransferase